MIEIKVKGTVLSAESKPYDFDGRSGVSHKVRMNIGGEIYVIKSSEDQVKALIASIGKEISGTLGVASRAERMHLEFLQ